MDNKMEMEIIWRDGDFIELQVICSSTVVSATAQIYVTNQLIASLISQIQMFLSREVEETTWINEKRGDDTTACLSLRFINADNCGHILIEVYMEIDDGGAYSVHHCCFFLRTEIGLLTTFGKNLSLLRLGNPGTKVVLNDF